MLPTNLSWQPYYGKQVQATKAARTEAAVVHACIWPNAPKSVPIDMTELVKWVYTTPSGVPGMMDTVVQFTERVDDSLFGNDRERVVFVVTAVVLDHVGQVAVVQEFSYQPNTYVRAPTEIVGMPLTHQFQIDYQLANAIREMACGMVKSDE